MKANELMIGDWVQNTNGNIGKVIGFQFYSGTERNEVVTRYHPNSTCWSECDVLKPTPLTAEILEKNGWSFDGCYANVELDDCKYLQYYPFEKRLIEWYEGKDEWQNNANVKEIIFKCQCTYIHELQHALRLCGLNDLADNFEV